MTSVVLDSHWLCQLHKHFEQRESILGKLLLALIGQPDTTTFIIRNDKYLGHYMSLECARPECSPVERPFTSRPMGWQMNRKLYGVRRNMLPWLPAAENKSKTE